jgi:hypothetical protein
MKAYIVQTAGWLAGSLVAEKDEVMFTEEQAKYFLIEGRIALKVDPVEQPELKAEAEAVAEKATKK